MKRYEIEDTDYLNFNDSDIKLVQLNDLFITKYSGKTYPSILYGGYSQMVIIEQAYDEFSELLKIYPKDPLIQILFGCMSCQT